MKLVMELDHINLKVVKFMMEFHHASAKRDKASVEASPHRLPYQ